MNFLDTSSGFYVGYLNCLIHIYVLQLHDFGSGMSYTSFNIAVDEVETNEDKVTVGLL